MFGQEAAGADEVDHHPLLGHASHAHAAFNRPAAAVQGETAVLLGHFDQAEIDVRAETPVELQFLGAVVPPLVRIGKIEKAEIDRFLELVDVVAGKEHIGDMRLHEPDIRVRVFGTFHPQKGLEPGRQVFVGHGGSPSSDGSRNGSVNGPPL